MNLAAAALLRSAARTARRLPAWEQQQWRGYASGQDPWVLVQREGGASTTATGDGTAGGSISLEQRYDSGGLGGSADQAAAPRFSLSRLRQGGLSQLQATFLPSGYPHSVATGYLRNTLWQAAHHCAGSANGVLASTFLLYSVGLGAGAVPTAGALNWVLKDGLGQLGTLLFGKAIAHRFDVSSRAWYLLASVKLNIAMGFEICTFLVPQYFLPIGAVANAIKGLSWMAGGSTKSVFKVAFAADNNFGDISAKATSQTIFSSVLGTSAGVLLAAQIEQSVGLALGCYTALAAMHLYAGYQAVRCVPLATLNPSRLELLVQRYLEQLQQQRQQAEPEMQPRQQQQQQQQQHGQPKWHPGHAAPAGRWPGEDGERLDASSGSSSQASSSSSSSSGEQQAAPADAGAVRLPTPAELAADDPVFHTPWVCVGTPLHKLVEQHGSRLGLLLQQQVGPQPGQQQGGSQSGQQQGGSQPGQQQGGAAKEQQQQGGAPEDQQRHHHQQQQGAAAEEQEPQQQASAGATAEAALQQQPQLHMLVPAGGCMHLLLHEQAAAADSILGFLHAFVLQHGTSGTLSPGAGCSKLASAVGSSGSSNGSSSSSSSSSSSGKDSSGGGMSSPQQLRSSLAEARRLLPGLLAALEAAGWDDEKVVLEAKRRRVTW